MTTAQDAIRIQGLTEFLAKMKALQVQTPYRVTRVALNRAAEIVAVKARQLAPVDTGALRGSIRVSSTGKTAGVAEGSARVPYAGATDYGNKRHSGHGVGRKDSGGLPFVATGRILYPAFQAERVSVQNAMDTALREAIVSVGLVVDE